MSWFQICFHIGLLRKQAIRSAQLQTAGSLLCLVTISSLVSHAAAAAAAKSLQLYPTLCDPKDGSPPGSAVPGILQARTLEWVAISFSNAWKWKVKVKSLSCVWLLVTPWTAAHQAPLSMGFSRHEYWSGVQIWRHGKCSAAHSSAPLSQKICGLAPHTIYLHNNWK